MIKFFLLAEAFCFYQSSHDKILKIIFTPILGLMHLVVRLLNFEFGQRSK